MGELVPDHWPKRTQIFLTIRVTVEDNRSQDAALEAYLDRMDELLERNLRASKKGDEVRVSARARKITKHTPTYATHERR
jgi:hypothetical protein